MMIMINDIDDNNNNDNKIIIIIIIISSSSSSSSSIERVLHFKYLWVILDQHLNFEEHVSVLYNTSSSKPGDVNKKHNCVGCFTALSLYKSLVMSNSGNYDVINMTANKDTLKKSITTGICRILLLASHYMLVEDMHVELELHVLPQRNFHLPNLSQNIYFNE